MTAIKWSVISPGSMILRHDARKYFPHPVPRSTLSEETQNITIHTSLQNNNLEEIKSIVTTNGIVSFVIRVFTVQYSIEPKFWLIE